MALSFVLPFVTGGIPEIGSMLSPMHIPAFLFGVIGGPLVGGILAFLSPLLRSLMLGSPILFPRAVCMAFELFAYAFVFAFLRKRVKFKSSIANQYIALVISMLAGRVLGGIVKFVLFGFGAIGNYSVKMFFVGYFVETIPAVILQLVIIVPIITALKRAKVIEK